MSLAMLLNPWTIMERRVLALSRMSCSILSLAAMYDNANVAILIRHMTIVSIIRNLFLILMKAPLFCNRLLR